MATKPSGQDEPSQSRFRYPPKHEAGMSIFSRSAGSSSRLIHWVYSSSPRGADHRFDLVSHAGRRPQPVEPADQVIHCLAGSWTALSLINGGSSGDDREAHGEHRGTDCSGLGIDVAAIVTACIYLVKMLRVFRPVTNLTARPVVARLAVCHTIGVTHETSGWISKIWVSVFVWEATTTTFMSRACVHGVAASQSLPSWPASAPPRHGVHPSAAVLQNQTSDVAVE
eukprot:4938448-Prymnesium_polylepis.9